MCGILALFGADPQANSELRAELLRWWSPSLFDPILKVILRIIFYLFLLPNIVRKIQRPASITETLTEKSQRLWFSKYSKERKWRHSASWMTRARNQPLRNFVHLSCYSSLSWSSLFFFSLSKLLRHRGPDWNGITCFRNCYLAHERLAINGLLSGAQVTVFVGFRSSLFLWFFCCCNFSRSSKNWRHFSP